jgi:hypothetical protein
VTRDGQFTRAVGSLSGDARARETGAQRDFRFEIIVPTLVVPPSRSTHPYSCSLDCSLRVAEKQQPLQQR